MADEGKRGNNADEIVSEIYGLLHALEKANKSEEENIYNKSTNLANNGGIPVYELLANALYPTIAKELNAELGNRSLYLSVLFGKIGDAAVPALLPVLTKSEWAHHALGHVGSDKAIDILIKELQSSNWRRVEAGARGLGIAKIRKALPALRQIYTDLPKKMPVGEVSIACKWAIDEIEKTPPSKELENIAPLLDIIQAEAKSVREAREIIKGQIPHGLSILEETIVSDGYDKVVTASGATTDEAKSKAMAKIPEGATIMNEREITSSSQKRMVIEGMDENTAMTKATKHKPNANSLIRLSLKTVGNKVLGIWKRPNHYEAIFDCSVEIRYKPKAKISAKIGDIRTKGRVIELPYPSLATGEQLPSNARHFRVYEECEVIPIGEYKCPICRQSFDDLSSRNPNIVLKFQRSIGSLFWWSLVPHCGKKFLVSNSGF